MYLILFQGILQLSFQKEEDQGQEEEEESQEEQQRKDQHSL
jgi:hypothetical protein